MKYTIKILWGIDLDISFGQNKKCTMGTTVKLKSEMARAYGISLPTFRKMISRIGIDDKHTKYLTPKRIKEIEEHFGKPDYELIKPSLRR